jgi:putative endonuclease
MSKNGIVPGHTKRYRIGKLVYFEVYSTAYDAIQREKNIKHWPRVWKTVLLQKQILSGVIFMMRSCSQ